VLAGIAWVLVASTGESAAETFRAKLAANCELGSRSAERAVKELRTLRAPDSMAPSFRQFVTAIEDSRRLAFEAERANRRGDRRATQKAMDEGFHALDHADAAAERLGVEQCRV
jgi:hypothetical protein